MDGILFDSKLEMRYYADLKMRVAAGHVITFIPQVSFRLPGGVRYRCDFMEFWDDGSVHVIDVKGAVTKEFTARKKMVEEVYAPIVIEIVTAKDMR